MRPSNVLACLSSAFLLTVAVYAQNTVYAQDGGTREVLESIFIPPIPNAPFTLTLETEWTRSLGNGGTYTAENQRHIMRDARGRIFQERRYLVPKNGRIPSQTNYVQIEDPNAHTLYNCEMATKRCYLLVWKLSAMPSYQPLLGPPGPLPNNSGFRTREDLGHSNLLGIDTIGYRETLTLNPWVMGNDQPMVTTREFWWAPKLGISLLSTLESPQAGKQHFTVSEISTDEPDPSFFTVPKGFTVVDERKTEPPSD